jgi:xanthine dehydrogenase accessory factor
MEDIFFEIVRDLREKKKVSLATLISRIGSAPREEGAKYLIRKEGPSIGSIGGGCVEAEVWQEGQGVIEKGEGKVLHFNLTSEQLAEGGLICGGNIKVLIEPLREDFLPIYEEIIEIKQRGGSAVLATVISMDGKFPSQDGVKILIKSGGEKIGSLFLGEGLEKRILEEMDSLLKLRKPTIISFKSEKQDHPWKYVEVLLEPILSEQTVYLFGAGHISQQLAFLAKIVKFKVVVIDDREMFANRERFPDADEIIVSDFEEAFNKINIDQSSYIVIVTRGHLYDGIVLEKAIKTNARYIGMIGSKNKIRILFKNLLEKGVPEEQLKKVYAPIGIDINSETPEEIAISIIAQLIKIRREKLA